MAGTKRFEPSEALDRALRVFWEKGFEGASYSELTNATGLNKSSLYNAFGDKQALYIKCLERFSETIAQPEMALLRRPDFADAIAGLFESLVQRMNDAAQPRGCLVTMAALELGGAEGPVGHSFGPIFRSGFPHCGHAATAPCATASCRPTPIPRHWRRCFSLSCADCRLSTAASATSDQPPWR